mmetsp:Transcript_65984/g.56035  ORF Transcript_65984/g.56035 Transcript_65984/m.56035 type:complete len:122 (+) Transcript_65984:308-673(+)
MDKQNLINILNSYHCTNPVEKVQNIKRITKIIIEKYNQDIPPNFDELLQLPGVGPKVASCVWNNAHSMVKSIAVDVHVHEICNRLGFVDSNTAEETRVQLEKWLPLELWDDVHSIMVPFGT